MTHKSYVEYITVHQLVVVETLLLGLRNKSFSDFFVNYDGYLKVESTRVLMEAGYTVIDDIDTDTRSALQFTLNSSIGKVESSQILLGITNCKPLGKRDVILLNPDVKFEVIGLERKNNSELLESGVERMCRGKINALVSVASESDYEKIQEQYPTLLPLTANLQPYFTESAQQFTNKSGLVKEEEVVCRACKVACPATNGSRIVFAVFRPNELQKQVESLTDNKASLEIQRDEQSEDSSYLTTEILALKKEIDLLNSERSDIQVGSGEFEAERDLLIEEKQEVEVERDALKIEAAALRKKIHKLELELEAFHEIKSKKTYSLSDSDDDEIKTTTTTTTTSTSKHEESMEVGLDEDEDDDDDDIKYKNTDLMMQDDDDEKPGFTNMGGDGLSIKTLSKGLYDNDNDDDEDKDDDKDDEDKTVVKKSIKIEEDESDDDKSDKVDLDDNAESASVTEEENESITKDDENDEDDEKKSEVSDKEKKDDLNSDDEVQLEKKKSVSIKNIEDDDDDDSDSSDWSE